MTPIPTPLQAAAEAVIKRWDSPLWRQEVHTAEIINSLRHALAAESADAPVQADAVSEPLLPAFSHFLETTTDEMQKDAIRAYAKTFARAVLALRAAPVAEPSEARGARLTKALGEVFGWDAAAQPAAAPEAGKPVGPFEEWAEREGLETQHAWAMVAEGDIPCTSDGVLIPATYWQRETEIAWRAWGNKPSAADGAQEINDDQIYDMLSALAGIDTYDVNLRDHPKAYEAVRAALAGKGEA